MTIKMYCDNNLDPHWFIYDGDEIIDVLPTRQDAVDNYPYAILQEELF